MRYRAYSDYMREKYGEKVYKIPVNLNLTCPNRDGTKGFGGCIFCGETGSGYELLSGEIPVREQIEKNIAYIGPRYKAKKFIAYFQSFSNTYMDDARFEKVLEEARSVDGVVGVSISTRPDCVSDEKIRIMKKLVDSGFGVTVELGLQSANNRTLDILNRGHSVEEYLDCAARLKVAGIDLSTHLIVDLPWDREEDILKASEIVNRYSDHVKLHSLYIEKGTKLAAMYEAGEVKLLSSNDFIRRAALLLTHLKPEMIIDRLIGRIPEENCLICNWHTSWWKIRDELMAYFDENSLYQGSSYRHMA